MIPKVDMINSFKSPNKPIALKSLYFKTERKSSKLVAKERILVSALVASITNKWQMQDFKLGSSWYCFVVVVV